ncbi:[acyl-carrier-protein] S-malonyltransferase [Salvia divinorum]|uniref:[acyl-carrier-protein] S-malonyltransferase n=1 Tax=Salvia divinorum TaxID=28513 RepID=A0ABD1GDG6_SALDI
MRFSTTTTTASHFISFVRFTPPSAFSSRSAAMSSAIALPSISLSNSAFSDPDSFRSSVSLRFRNETRRVPRSNLGKSRVFMSVAVGSEAAVFDDALFKDYRPSTAFLFPGQGAQAVGMGAEAQNVPAAAELYKKANDILGFDLLDICISGPKEKLDSTVLSQPAIYVTREYTALAFAGAFSFEDGLKLVKLRGKAMQDAADAAQSAMVSIIGLDSDKVQALCDAANEDVDEANKVQIANFLCTGNYAVSGGLKGIEAVEAKAKAFKARMTVRLAVAGAFHTGFMEPAVSRLEVALASTVIRKPRIPVISNVDAEPHADPETIKKILARQVTSPVQWETTVKTLLSRGLKKGYELGPGKVIAGIVKRMDRGADIENIGA